MQLYNIDYISWHTGHDGIAECDFLFLFFFLFFDNLAECDLSDTSMSKWFRVITVIGEIKLRPTINTTTKPPRRMMV